LGEAFLFLGGIFLNNATLVDFPRMYGTPLLEPEQAKPLLKWPDIQWKPQKSAYETAHAWINAGKLSGGGIPSSARAVLDQAQEWRDAKVVIGLFEHATALDTQTGPSTTDILVVCDVASGLGAMAVEGKAGEDFDKLVKTYRLQSPGKEARLKWACDQFGIQPDVCGDLRWQLFHRTLSAVIEAKHFKSSQALMLVHDFSGVDAHFGDYEAFGTAIGYKGMAPGALTPSREFNGVSLRLGWVSDKLARYPTASKSTTR
jgi:hypothetical protein